MAELMFGNALFVCESGEEYHQLQKIWSVRGTPDLNTYTNDWERKTVQQSYARTIPSSSLRTHLTKPVNKNANADLFTPSAIQLLEFALEPNHALRATAKQMMESAYMSVDRPTPFTLPQLRQAK